MGVVDLARDQAGNQVALKRLTLTGSASEVLRSRQRLLREAEVLRRLHHPNVVRLLEVVEEGDDVVLVMPYLAGGNLADRVAQHGPAPADEIDRLAQRLLGALAEAHAAGIIHRDVKPANVLYDDQAEPYLADFGLAHTWDQTAGLTVAGMVVGTPGFMPPEQARDEPLTPASDIFALGATLLFAATAGGPFGTGDPSLLMVRAASGRVEKVPKSLPKALRMRLASMLDPRPERRPTAAALLAAYEPARGGRWPRPASPASVRPGVAVGVAVGCLAIAGGAFVVAGSDGDGDSGAAPPDDGPSVVVGDDDDAAPGTSAPPAPGVEGETALVDRLDTMLEPSTSRDTYPLPIGAGGEPCPRAVEVSLTLTSPDAAPLRLVVLAGGAVVGEDIARTGDQAAVVFGPQRACTEKLEILVVVEPTTPLLEPVPYALERYDTL